MFWSDFFYLHNWIMREAKVLARSHLCTGSLEPLLLADVISNKLSCAGPIITLSKSDRTFNYGPLLYSIFQFDTLNILIYLEHHLGADLQTDHIFFLSPLV